MFKKFSLIMLSSSLLLSCVPQPIHFSEISEEDTISNSNTYAEIFLDSENNSLVSNGVQDRDYEYSYDSKGELKRIFISALEKRTFLYIEDSKIKVINIFDSNQILEEQISFYYYPDGLFKGALRFKSSDGFTADELVETRIFKSNSSSEEVSTLSYRIKDINSRLYNMIDKAQDVYDKSRKPIEYLKSLTGPGCRIPVPGSPVTGLNPACVFEAGAKAIFGGMSDFVDETLSGESEEDAKKEPRWADQFEDFYNETTANIFDEFGQDYAQYARFPLDELASATESALENMPSEDEAEFFLERGEFLNDAEDAFESGDYEKAFEDYEKAFENPFDDISKWQETSRYLRSFSFDKFGEKILKVVEKLENSVSNKNYKDIAGDLVDEIFIREDDVGELSKKYGNLKAEAAAQWVLDKRYDIAVFTLEEAEKYDPDNPIYPTLGDKYVDVYNNRAPIPTSDEISCDFLGDCSGSTPITSGSSGVPSTTGQEVPSGTSTDDFFSDFNDTSGISDAINANFDAIDSLQSSTAVPVVCPEGVGARPHPTIEGQMVCDF